MNRRRVTATLLVLLFLPLAVGTSPSAAAPAALGGLTDSMLTGLFMKVGFDDGGAILYTGDPATLALTDAVVTSSGGGSLPLGQVAFVNGAASVSLAGLAPGSYAVTGNVNGLDPVEFHLQPGELFADGEEPLDPTIPDVGIGTASAAATQTCILYTPAYPAGNRWNVPFGAGANAGTQNPGNGGLTASSAQNAAGGAGGDWSYLWPTPTTLNGNKNHAASATFTVTGTGWVGGATGAGLGPGSASASTIGAVWEWRNGWTLLGAGTIGSTSAPSDLVVSTGVKPGNVGGTLTLPFTMKPRVAGFSYYAPFYDLAQTSTKAAPLAWSSASLSTTSQSLLMCGL